MSENLNVAPLQRLDLPSVNAFVRELNARLKRVSEVLDNRRSKLVLGGELDAGSFRIKNVATARAQDDAVPLGQLEEVFENLRRDLVESLTSEGEEEGVGGGGDGDTSRGRRNTDDEITQALLDAVPTVAPPNVAAVSNVGTTTDPPIFALSDHTHGGVLGGPPAGGVAGQVAFFTSTFEVGGDTAFVWASAGNTLNVAGTIRIGDLMPATLPLEVLGNVLLDNAGTAAELLFREPSAGGSEYTSFKAQAQAATINYTLPAVQGAANTFLQNNGSGVLLWATAGTVTSVAGGEGITNTPEPIIGAGTVNLDINSLTSETTSAAGDLFPFVDVSVGTTPASQRKATLTNIGTAIQTALNLVDGAGAAGQVAFWSDANTITGENALFWDATNNRLGIGATDPSQPLEIVGTSTGTSTAAASAYSNTVNQGGRWRFARSRGTRGGGEIAVASGDTLGQLVYLGHDGTSFGNNSAVILVTAAEAFTTGAHGGQLDFQMQPAGSNGAPVLRMRLTSTGDLQLSSARSGATLQSLIDNTSNTANAEAQQLISVAGGTAADPYTTFTVSGVQSWSVGIDNSNSDKFKLSRGAVLGTNDVFVVTTGDLVGITQSTPIARFHITEGTLGNEAFRIESVATNDDPNYRVFQNRVATTDATVTTLHTYTVPASTTAMIEARVIARRTGGAAGTAEDGAGYIVYATVKNIANTATLIGAVTVVVTHEDQANWDCTIDVTGATARVRVTGATNNNITWHGTIFVQNVES